MDAACKGAQFGLKIIGAIVANIVAFVSFVAFINAVITWLGHLVGVDNLSFEVRKKSKKSQLYYYLNDLRFLLFIDRLSVHSTYWVRCWYPSLGCWESILASAKRSANWSVWKWRSMNLLRTKKWAI